MLSLCYTQLPFFDLLNIDMKKTITLMASVFALLGCQQTDVVTTDNVAKSSQELKLVSWNIEHLADQVGKGCKPRSETDYKALADYAATLDADVVALQEVESEKAISRVFPSSQWQYVVSSRPAGESYECRGHDGLFSTQQRTALVIRKGVSYQVNPDFEKLTLGNPNLRHGTSISLNNGALKVLNVHMKSGCFVSDYSTSDKKSCLTYQQQAPILEKWVNDNVAKQQAFVVMGDFNHRLADKDNKFWQELSAENNKTLLETSMQNLESCHPKYKSPIDHIITGPLASNWVVAGSQKVDAFGKTGELEYKDMLSDHCPISVNIAIK